MKNLYYNTQKFMFRIPNDVERKLDFTEEEIKNACLDAKFREKVSIANLVLKLSKLLQQKYRLLKMMVK